MPITIPTTEPTEITIGETIKWKKTFANYSPGNGWLLAYYFRGAGTGLDIEGDLIAADGNSFLITIPAYADEDQAATSNLAAGQYFWQSWATNSTTGEEVQIDEGRTEAKQNLFNSDLETPYDGRTEAEKSLDAVRVALGKAAAQNRLEYQIAGRMKREHSIPDLLALEQSLITRVNNERAGAAGDNGPKPFGRRVEVRFTEP